MSIAGVFKGTAFSIFSGSGSYAPLLSAILFLLRLNMLRESPSTGANDSVSSSSRKVIVGYVSSISRLFLRELTRLLALGLTRLILRAGSSPAGQRALISSLLELGRLGVRCDVLLGSVSTLYD